MENKYFKRKKKKKIRDVINTLKKKILSIFIVFKLYCKRDRLSNKVSYLYHYFNHFKIKYDTDTIYIHIYIYIYIYIYI